MADRIAVQFAATGNFEPLLAQIKAVNAELERINKQYLASGKIGKDTYSELGNVIDSHVASLKGWQVSNATTKTSINQMTDDIIRQRYQIDKFPKTISGIKTAWQDAGRVADQQLRLMKSQFVALSRDAAGNVSGKFIMPTGPIKELASEAEISHAKLSAMNAMLRSSTTQWVNWGKNVQWAGRQLTYGISLPIAGVLGGIGILAYQLNEQQSRLKAVYGTASTSSAELNRAVVATTQTAKEMASQFGVSGKETVALGADFAAAGYQGLALQQIIKATTQIQVLGETDRQSALQASISLMNAFHLSAGQLTDTFNHMNAVENQTVLTTQDMITAIPRAAAPIAQLGGSVNDLIILLTAMKAGGINAEQGSVAVNRAVTSLIRPTATAVKELEGMGIHIDNLFEKHKNDPMPVLATFQDLGRQLDKLTATDRQQAIVALFGKFQNPRITAMLDNIISRTGKVGDQVQQALNAVNMTAGQAAAVTQREIDQRMNSTSGRLRRAWASITTDLAAGGQTVLKAATPLVEVFAKVIHALSALPGPVKSFLTLGAVLAALVGPMVMLIGLFANFTGNIAKGAIAFVKYIRGLSDLETRETIIKKLTDSLTLSFAEEQDQVSTLITRLETLIGTYDALARKEGVKTLGLNYVATGTAAEEATAASQVMAPVPIPIKKSGIPSAKNLLKYGQAEKAVISQDVAGTWAAVAANTGKTSENLVKTERTTGLWRSGLGKAIPTVAMLATSVALLKGSSDGVGHSFGSWLLALTPMLFVLPSVISGVEKLVTAIKAARAAQVGLDIAQGAGKVGGLVGVISSALTRVTALGAALETTTGIAALGVGAIAVAAVGGIVLWHRHMQDIEQKQRDIIDAARNMAGVVGGSFAKADTWVKQVGKDAGKAASNVNTLADNLRDAANLGPDDMAKFLKAHQAQFKAYQGAITAYGQTGQQGLLNYVSDKSKEMLLGGVDPKKIQQSISDTLKFITGSDALKFKVAFDASESKKQLIDDVGGKYAAELGTKFSKNWGNALSSTSQAYIKELGKNLAELPLNPSQERRLVQRIAQPFQAAMNSLKDYQPKGAENQILMAQASIYGHAASGRQALSMLMQHNDPDVLAAAAAAIDNINPKLADMINNYTHAHTALDIFATSFAKQHHLTDENGKAITTFNGLLQAFGIYSDSAAGGANNAANGMDNLGRAAKKAAISMADANAFVTNLQSNVQSGISDATNYVLSEYDNQTQGMDSSYDNQQKSTDTHYSRLMKANRTYWDYLASQSTKGYKIPKSAAEEYYKTFVKGEDSTVKARNAAAKLIAKYNGESWRSEKTAIQRIKDKISAEKKAEAERQKIFQAEMQRLQRMASLEQININYQQALAGGNLDQAAQYMAEGMAQTQQNALQDAQDAGQTQAAADQKRLENRLKHIQSEIKHRKDWLNNERDANNRALENDKRTADKRLAANKRMMDQMRAQRRTELEQELNDLTMMVPRNAREMQKMFDDISKEAGTFGVNLSNQAGSWANMVSGTWARAVRESRMQVQNDNAWSRMGKHIANEVSNNMLGMSWNQFVKWMITGKMPKDAGAAAGTPNQHWLKEHKPAHMSMDNWRRLFGASHTGGPIHPGMYSSPGLRHDETARVLQHGEYVVQKRAVDKYGAPFFDAVNNMKMHVGGLVDPISTAAGGLISSKIVAALSLLIGRAAMNNVDKRNAQMPFMDNAAGGSGANLPANFKVGHSLMQFVPNIKTALAGHHLPTNKEYVNAVLYRMNIEDPSGNLSAVNKWDSNWAAGTPSVGLMQVIKPTFEGNAGPYKDVGPKVYGVSVDPTANIYAGIGHALGAYSKPFISVMTQAGGYDNGGILPHKGLGINMSGTPEVVFNARQWNTMETLATIGANNVKQLDNGGNTQYNVKVELHGSNLDASDVADVAIRKLQMMEMRHNQKRRIGNG